MGKLTEAQLQRRAFNRWFAGHYANADGGYDHFPRWLKNDLWECWQAAQKPCPHNCDVGGICLAGLSGFPQSCPEAGRRALQQAEGGAQ